MYSSTSPSINSESFQRVPTYEIHLHTIQFTVQEVREALENVDTSKSAGVDGLPPLVLKHCDLSLAMPVAHIFNRSLMNRTFPKVWKTALMIPIHKSGNIYQVENYRGISILCTLGKVFEKMIHRVLYRVAYPIISDAQHGFVQHRSTTTNLMCFASALFREVERKNQIDTVYVDFSKAFDVIPHDYTIEKLKHMGFPASITGWLHSYLTNRKASVRVNSASSEDFSITSGVPQGSVLGPLIFILFINDICFRLSSPKQLFADDLKFFRIITSTLDCLVLQADINELLLWCQENGMRINGTKSKLITFTRCQSRVEYTYTVGDTLLERVDSIRDLGVTIDSKLRFHEHISTVTAKAFSVLGFIRRHSSSFKDVYTLKALYCSLVRSILEYAAPVWAPYQATHTIRVERVQKKFIRFALRQLPWNDPTNLPAYSERCKLINIPTLAARRTFFQRIFVFDLLEGYIKCPELLEKIQLNVPQRTLRNPSALSIPLHRTNYGHNNPLTACLRGFNDVYAAYDFGISKGVFKANIRDVT